MKKHTLYMSPHLLQQWETARLNGSLRKDARLWELANRMIHRLHDMYGSHNISY